MKLIFAILAGLFFAFTISEDKVKHKIFWGVLTIMATVIGMTALILKAIEAI